MPRRACPWNAGLATCRQGDSGVRPQTLNPKPVRRCSQTASLDRDVTARSSTVKTHVGAALRSSSADPPCSRDHPVGSLWETSERTMPRQSPESRDARRPARWPASCGARPRPPPRKQRHRPAPRRARARPPRPRSPAHQHMFEWQVVTRSIRTACATPRCHRRLNTRCLGALTLAKSVSQICQRCREHTKNNKNKIPSECVAWSWTWVHTGQPIR